MATVRQSSARYKRKNKPPAIEIQDDDVRILWLAYRHRVISAETIRALFPDRSKDVLSRRLFKLFHNKYLDRLSQGRQYKPGGGSFPLCYALGAAGASLLKTEYGAQVSGTGWAQRNRQIRDFNVRHALKTTNAMVLFEQSAREHPELDMLHFDEVLSEFAPDKLDKKRLKTLRPRVEWRGYQQREGTTPDQIFSLFNPSAPEGRRHRIICLEIDRGTETIEPTERVLRNPVSFFKGSSLLRKFVVYGHAYQQRTHQEQFGVNAFQVLTITTTAERAEQIRLAYVKHLTSKPYEVRPALFLFTDWETIERNGGRMFDVPIVNGAGKVADIIVRGA